MQGQKMPQTQQRQGGGREGGDRRTAEERRISLAINSFQRDYNSTQETRQESDAKHFKWSRRAAKAAIGYTIFTACLLGLAVYSSIQTWNAIDAANRAADAATKQAGIAEDTEIRQLRPYLHILPGDTNWAANADGTIQISEKPLLKVAGQTPAGQVAIAWKLKIDVFPIVEGSFTFDTIAEGTATAVIFSGDPTYVAQQQITLIERDIDAINKGAKKIYSEGTVAYIESFAYTKKLRWSNFCFYTDMQYPVNGWFACAIHNGADWNPGSPASAIVPMRQ
jgi:hypothetical protein